MNAPDTILTDLYPGFNLPSAGIHCRGDLFGHLVDFRFTVV